MKVRANMYGASHIRQYSQSVKDVSRIYLTSAILIYTVNVLNVWNPKVKKEHLLFCFLA